MTTKVINIHHKEEYDVYIGRGSIWGNPYTHLLEGTTKAAHIVSSREESIEKYREYIESNKLLIKKLKKLKGKTLGCFCFPRPCHGDVLIELIQKYYG